MKKIYDELNPHIVWSLNKKIGKCFFLEENEKSLFNEFIQKYNKAKSLFSEYKDKFCGKDFVPLAYRLDIITGDEQKQDDITKDKLGGIPDIRNYMMYDFSIKNKTLIESISNSWPICKCCGKRMIFIGQMNYTNYINAIHVATSKKDDFFELSAFGKRDSFGFSERHLYFYCTCYNDIGLSYNSILLKNYVIPYRAEKKVLDLKDYNAEIQNFMLDNGIHPDNIKRGKIPLKFIEKYDLNFDLDWIFGNKNNLSYEEELEEIIEEVLPEALPSPSGKYGSDFTLFGKPESQQEQKRFFNPIGYNKATRMSPLINWTDEHEDFTYQIYGDFRYYFHMQKEVPCLVDGSCT